MTLIQFDTTHYVDTTLQETLVGTGPDAFVGIAAMQLSIKKRLLWKFSNTLAEQAQSATQAHQTFLDGTDTALLKLNLECEMLNGYSAAAGMLLIRHSPQISQSNINVRSRNFQGGYGGGLEDLIRLLILIVELAAIAAVILAIVGLAEGWIRGMNVLRSSQDDTIGGDQAADSNAELAQLYADLYAKEYGIAPGALKDLVEKLLDEGVDVSNEIAIDKAIELYKKGFTNTAELAKFIKQADTLLVGTALGTIVRSGVGTLTAGQLDLAAELYKKGLTDGTDLATDVIAMSPQQISQVQQLMKNIPALTAADILRRILPDSAYNANEGKRGKKSYIRPGGKFVSAEAQGAAQVLDNAVDIPGPTKRIVGVDPNTGEIILYDETSPNDYHSHIERWDELIKEGKRDVRSTLIDKGLVDKNGHIIIRDADGNIIRIGQKIK